MQQPSRYECQIAPIISTLLLLLLLLFLLLLLLLLLLYTTIVHIPVGKSSMKFRLMIVYTYTCAVWSCGNLLR
jgi:hypothetical protein